jgi:hypothetical protein
VECPRIAPKRAQVTGWLRPRKGYRPLFMGAGKVSGDALPENLVATEAMGVYSEPGSQNGNSGS